ncbi:AhpC/TSA family protein [Pontibacter ummariensis]|uniref:AhpC/TSA family protein n=1 Tax=Pontibacter ummariensis TaxID=1610492 RepID=A0A239BD83_9BACT|nr:thioredoxin family protein [Pontibacter ummariensis]PRY16462.1 AhpC/TSA family protein [Pontibacter ummariensis]SNS05582.1 AhpC/TSA family protein [Pontibacter ummariensis]
MKYLASLATAFLLTASAFAQTGGYQLGDKVADFSLQGSNNASTSLSDFANAKTVVLVFTNNHCPYAKLYENRLVTLASNYANRGVQFIFINPGLGDGSETLEGMASKNYSFPYLADQGQKLSAKFGATKTPEVFVLHNNNGEFILKYKGAIDDNPQVESSVKNYYLKNVIDEMLANKAVTPMDKRATGCLIKRY